MELDMELQIDALPCVNTPNTVPRCACRHVLQESIEFLAISCTWHLWNAAHNYQVGKQYLVVERLQASGESAG